MKAYRVYQQQLVQQETMKQMQPMMNQLADDRFMLAMARVEQDSPNFSKYFPRETLVSRFEGIKKQIGVQAAGTANWEVELRNAYRIADMPRVEAENKRLQTDYEKLQKKMEEMEGKGKETRAKQKADLKLVPKAGNQGATSAKKRSFQDELDDLPPTLSMSSFADRIKAGMPSILGA